MDSEDEDSEEDEVEETETSEYDYEEEDTFSNSSSRDISEEIRNNHVANNKNKLQTVKKYTKTGSNKQNQLKKDTDNEINNILGTKMELRKSTQLSALSHKLSVRQLGSPSIKTRSQVQKEDRIRQLRESIGSSTKYPSGNLNNALKEKFKYASNESSDDFETGSSNRKSIKLVRDKLGMISKSQVASLLNVQKEKDKKKGK